MSHYDYVVLEGGGTKGMAYGGVAKSLEQMGVLKDIKGVGGASAGAIASLLFSTGWTADRITSTLTTLDLGALAKGGILDQLLVTRTLRKEYGLFDADGLHDWLGEVVASVTGNPNTTFEQWHEFKKQHPELGLKDIFVKATNTNRQTVETFSYLSEHKDVKIKDAVRASAGFPFFFTPFKIKGCNYSDGGMQDNCPTSLFEAVPGQFNPRVLAFRLDSRDEIEFYKRGVPLPFKAIKSFFQQAMAHLGSLLNVQNVNFFASQYKNNTVFLDTLDIETLDFDPTPDKISALLGSGEFSTIRYFLRKHPEVAAATYSEKLLTQINTANTGSFTDFVKFQQNMSKKFTDGSGLITFPSPAKEVAAASPPEKRWKYLTFLNSRLAANSSSHADSSASCSTSQAAPEERASSVKPKKKHG